MKKIIDYSIYLVTDTELMSAATVEECVKKAILGGATLVQLREKNLDSLDFFNEAARVKNICDRYGVGLIINDRIDIALAIGADGVHVGQSDIPAAVVRKVIGEDMLLGVSATTVEEAEKACGDGADYIGVGAMFYTGTKTDAKIVTKVQLKAIKAAVKVPIVVIGGINENTIPEFDDCDIDGVAVVSAIVSKPDIVQAARNIKSLFFNKRRKTLNGKKLAMFDLDGTLLDSLGVWKKIDSEFFKSRGLILPENYMDDTMPLSFIEAAEYTVKNFNLNDTPEELTKEWHSMAIAEYTDNIPLKNGAREYLEMLKREGLTLAVVTSLSRELYLPVLKSNGILELFDYTFSVDEVGVGKTSGKIYEYALKTCGTTAKNAVLFEDIPDAAYSGKMLGLTVVGIKDVYNCGTLDELVKIADITISDFVQAPVIKK